VALSKLWAELAAWWVNDFLATWVALWQRLNDGLATMLLEGLGQSLYMTFVATAFAYLVGLPLGVLLVVTRRGYFTPQPRSWWARFVARMVSVTHHVLEVVVNILRSIPFLILMVAAFPLTRAIIGRVIGTTGTIIPLIVASFPFVARTVESSLLEVDGGVIEAAQAMGATRLQIIRKVLIREAVPGLLNGAAIAITNILGYSAMAGAIGGGGLGAIAINYGYNRNDQLVLWSTIFVLVIVVQVFQLIGTRASRLVDHRQK
jgi:D-methionine transport system permease protein